MALPSAARTRMLDRSVLMDEPWLIGPARDGPTGAITGGKLTNEIVVTNLTNSDSGSLRAACASAVSAGGGWITFAVNGTITLTSTIVLTNSVNITIDARGNDIRLSGKGIRFDTTSGGSATQGNLIVLNVRFTSGTGGSNTDAIQAFSINHDITPIFYAHCAVTDWRHHDTGGTADEMIDMSLDCPDSRGKDITGCWNLFEHIVSGSQKTLSMISTAATNQNAGKYQAHLHHNYWKGGVAFRSPLIGSDNFDNTGIYAAVSNNVREWAEDGASARRGTRMWSEQETLDGTYASGASLNYGVKPITAASATKVVSPRLLNAGSYTEQNATAVVDPRTRWASYAVCTASAAHDTLVKARAGNKLMVTNAGTLNGVAADAVSGKTVSFSWPSTQGILPAAGAAFEAVRQTLLDEITISGGQGDGNTICSSVTGVARTADRTFTVTCDTNPTLTEDAEIYYSGSTAASTWLMTWNPSVVTAVEAPPSGGAAETTFRISHHTTTDAISFTSAAGQNFAPANGSVLTVMIFARDEEEGIVNPALTGWGLTFAQRRRVNYLFTTSADVVGIICTATVSGSPSSGGLTVDFTGSSSNVNGCTFWVLETTGIDTTTNDGVAATDDDAPAEDGTGTEANLTLPGTTGNVTIAATCVLTNTADYIAWDSPLVVANSGNFASPPHVASVAFVDAPDASPRASWAAALGYTAIAVELTAAATGADIEVPATTQTYTTYAPTVVIPTPIVVPAASQTYTTYAPLADHAAEVEVPTATQAYTTYAPEVEFVVPLPGTVTVGGAALYSIVASDAALYSVTVSDGSP